jgi:hypothetical protein
MPGISARPLSAKIDVIASTTSAASGLSPTIVVRVVCC